MAIRRVVHEALLNTPTATLTNAEVLRLTMLCVRQLVQRHSWTLAFAKTGYGASQTLVTTTVLRQLHLTPPVHIPSTRPTLAELQNVFPMRSIIPINILFRQFDPQPPKAPPPAPCPPRRLPRAVPLAPPLTTATLVTRARARDAATFSLSSHRPLPPPP